MKVIVVAVFVALSVAYVSAILPLASCPAAPALPTVLVEPCYNPKLALFQKYPLMYKLKAKLCKLCCDPLKEVIPCSPKNPLLPKLPCLPAPAPPMLTCPPAPCAPPCPPPCLPACAPPCTCATGSCPVATLQDVLGGLYTITAEQCPCCCCEGCCS